MKLQQIGIAIALGFLLPGELVTVPGLLPGLMRPAYAGEPIPNQAEWRTKKDQFRLPDGLDDDVKMGREFQRFTDDYGRARNRSLNVQLPIVRRLEANLSKYISSVQRINQNRQYDGAIAYLQGVLATVQELETQILNQLNPAQASTRVKLVTESSSWRSPREQWLAAILSNKVGNGVMWVTTYTDPTQFYLAWMTPNGNRSVFENPSLSLSQVDFAPSGMPRMGFKEIYATRDLRDEVISYFKEIESYFYDGGSYTLHVAILKPDMPGVSDISPRRSIKQPRIVIVLNSNQNRVDQFTVWQAWLEKQ